VQQRWRGRRARDAKCLDEPARACATCGGRGNFRLRRGRMRPSNTTSRILRDSPRWGGLCAVVVCAPVCLPWRTCVACRWPVLSWFLEIGLAPCTPCIVACVPWLLCFSPRAGDGKWHLESRRASLTSASWGETRPLAAGLATSITVWC